MKDLFIQVFLLNSVRDVDEITAKFTWNAIVSYEAVLKIWFRLVSGMKMNFVYKFF